ncbi:twin-arginine translocation signal domain-containing protein [Halorussus litoreus]|uniref:twin-arginine translocation signal domain-containing protein n=1 Tax=Halorussus litoreus TaxID=1710536 RepID=UPI000E284C08|nr:twin-arginine translocation signal domain-containing protein [Halorussus litoreus]
MTQRSRRSILRAGGGLALAASLAGCTGRFDVSASAEAGIPGVEDGEVTDKHAFATAHSDSLSARSGTVEWTRASLDRETGDAKTHSVWTVRVEGDRVHATIDGRTLWGWSDVDRVEFYFGEDSTTVFWRKRVDGEWEAMMAEPQETGISKSGYTGRSRLEVVDLHEIGTETVGGEELTRFGKTSQAPDDEKSVWYSIQALVDDDALVHSFQETLDGTERNGRRFTEWHLADLDETTVERPDWVDGVGE